jgi:hypothetical protein
MNKVIQPRVKSQSHVSVGRNFSKSKSHYDRRSVGQFVLVYCPFWSKWPDVTNLPNKPSSWKQMNRIKWRINETNLVRIATSRYFCIFPFPSSHCPKCKDYCMLLFALMKFAQYGCITCAVRWFHEMKLNGWSCVQQVQIILPSLWQIGKAVSGSFLCPGFLLLLCCHVNVKSQSHMEYLQNSLLICTYN